MSFIWVKLVSGILLILIASFNFIDNLKKYPLLTSMSLAVGVLLLFLSFNTLFLSNHSVSKFQENTNYSIEKTHLAKEMTERERIAKEKAEKERLAKEHAQVKRIDKEKAEEERLAKEKAEKVRLDKEDANEYSVSHKHGERTHRHPLPREGNSHSHHAVNKGNSAHAVGLDKFIPAESNVNKVDTEINKLKSANIVFNAPSEMLKNKAYNVNLKLNARKKIDVLLDELKGTEKGSASVIYSTKMKASIIGEKKKAFEIIPITPSEQAISSINTTTWQWDIVPIQSGVHHFHIILIAFIQIDEKELKFPIKTFDQKIIVTVSASDEISSFLEANWKWLLGSLIFPLVVWLWKIRFQRGKEAAESKNE